MEILQRRYGTANVLREEGYVDIKLTKPDGVTYIEIKTAAQPHLAFRADPHANSEDLNL